MRVDPVTLEGAHVRLEPLTIGHLDPLCQVGLDPELWRWSPWLIRNRDEMRGWLETALRQQAEGTALPFVTIHHPTSRVAGSTRFGGINRPHRRVEIGWTWVTREFQRTPVNTEAKYLMLRHAFETLGCLRVEFKTDALNERSRAAIRRLGAVEEGVLRSHMITAGGRVRDSVCYSVIAAEWPAVKAGLEARLGAARTAPG